MYECFFKRSIRISITNSERLSESNPRNSIRISRDNATRGIKESIKESIKVLGFVV